MEVQTAQLGWCVGIDRAYRLMNKQAALAAGQPLYAIHRCHQPHANDDLDTLRRIEHGDSRLFARYPALQGVQVVHEPEQLIGGETLLLGFHGLPSDTREELVGRGVSIKDYKCPFIARLDKTADQLTAEGFDILIMGQRENHHCMYAQEAARRNQRQCVVLEKLEDVDTIPHDTAARWVLIGQVTGNTLLWAALDERLQQRGITAQVRQTVCSDSFQRQEEALELAQDADCCLIVDDGGAASLSLFQVLSTVHRRVYRCRWREDGSWQAGMDAAWFAGVERVAVVGGILIPQWALAEVAAYIKDVA